MISSLPKNEEIKNAFEKDFGRIYSIEKLVKGTSGNTFIINSDKKYILKLHGNKKLLQKKIRQLRKINEKNEITINPTSPKVLGNDKFFGYAYKYFEGETYENSNDKNKIFILGKLAGIFDKQAKVLTKPCKNNKYYKEVIQSYKKNKDYFCKLPNKEELIEVLEKGFKLLKDFGGKKFRCQIVHSDIHFQNVLYYKKKYKIIDIDGLRENNLVIEPVTMVSFFMQYPNFEKNAKLFLKGYESEFKLLKEEKLAIPYFSLLRAFGEILWFIFQLKNGFNTLDQYNKWTNNSIQKAKIIMNDFDKLLKLFGKI